MQKFHVKKGEEVVVISGTERGKRGKIIEVLRDKNRVIVEGVKMIKRHTKPNPGKGVKGGIVEREASLHASNVQLVCPECGVQTRIGHKTLGDGRKVRMFPVAMRYCWPSELDLMAELAGLRLRERYADFGRVPFGADSRRHVSVYEPLGG